VQVSATAIGVSAIEVAAGDRNLLAFLHGGCDFVADRRGCVCAVDYLASVELERSGAASVA